MNIFFVLGRHRPNFIHIDLQKDDYKKKNLSHIVSLWVSLSVSPCRIKESTDSMLLLAIVIYSLNSCNNMGGANYIQHYSDQSRYNYVC